MTASPGAEWERHADGSHISIPIRPRDADEVRAWCGANCTGNFLIDLGRRVIFEKREDAALATVFWRAEER